MSSTEKNVDVAHRPTMAKLLYETFSASDLSESMFKEASKLFNSNYGIWGAYPTGSQRMPKRGESRRNFFEPDLTTKIGSRVKLSEDRLRAQCLPENVDCSYAKVTINNRLVGNAFAGRWKDKKKTVCWITQLVVHRDYRRRGIATHLLTCLRRNNDDVYGILSSHPAACLAAVMAFGSGVTSISTTFIQEDAASVMESSPVTYVKNAVPRGALFDAGDVSGAIASVFTEFYVDHGEPLEALQWVRERGLV